MGNPHLAALTDVDVDALDLTGAPGVRRRAVPRGRQRRAGQRARARRAHIRLRVFERGVGETRSCGTGACAAAYAALAAEHRTEGTVVVDVPGGRLSVQVTPGTTVLTGPAVVVAAGVLCAGVAGRLSRRSGAVVVVGRRLRHHRLALGARAVVGSP